MKRYTLLRIGWLLFLVGCQRPPEFVNHSRPALTVDFSVFETVGCPPDEYGRMYCEGDSPLAALGCDRIRKPSELLGGLEPSFPIGVCLVEPYRNTDEPESADARMPAEGEYFYRTGGLYPIFVRYVLFGDDQLRLIETEEEFRGIFSPIDSPDEALSYALAVTNLSAYYNLEFNPDYEYFVNELEDTHVDVVEDGYIVHLYRYQAFGCGPHNTSAVDLLITNQGSVEEVAREAVYKDPSEDDLCVD
jgi:hypothetical protein